MFLPDNQSDSSALPVVVQMALARGARVIALETINQGITCNAICPGAVLTPTLSSS